MGSSSTNPKFGPSYCYPSRNDLVIFFTCERTGHTRSICNTKAHVRCDSLCLYRLPYLCSWNGLVRDLAGNPALRFAAMKL